MCPAGGPPTGTVRLSARGLRRVDGNLVGETPPAPPHAGGRLRWGLTPGRRPALWQRARGIDSGQGRPRPLGSQAPRPWPLSGEGLTC